MARMKDIKDKFNTIKDKFKADKTDDRSLRLSYDTSFTLNNIAITKELCTEMKRIGSYGIATYSISEDDKKLKKKSLSTLSTLFADTSTKFLGTDPMRGPLNHSASILAKINTITQEYERNLHHQVIEPLAKIEIDCIEIQELRKKLHDLKRDIGSQHDKLARMLDQSNSDEQKCNALKDQIEELKLEFENISDLYLLKIFQFESSKFEHAQAIHEMILLRTEYHEKCAKELKKILPDAEKFMGDRRTPYSFSYPLEDHLREIKKCIAYPIEKCVTTLSNVENLREQGLFRVSGVKSKSNLLCSVLNIMKFDKMTYKWPSHVVADALKRYLREMPVAMLGKVNSSEWENCYETFKSGNKQAAYGQIKTLIDAMPKSYYNNLEYIIHFLCKVVQEQSHNLMGIQNICTVFTPNLFEKSTTIGMNMEMSSSSNFVLESLLTDTTFFFSGENQNMSSSLVKTRKKVHRIKINEEDNNKAVVYKPPSDNVAECSNGRSNADDRKDQHGPRCTEPNMNQAGEPARPTISSQSSITSISSDTNSRESPIPIPPPRKNKPCLP